MSKEETVVGTGGSLGNTAGLQISSSKSSTACLLISVSRMIMIYWTSLGEDNWPPSMLFVNRKA
jgi:hypothetical protein